MRDGRPVTVEIVADGTLITSHSEKERAPGNYKGGFGFHPMHAYADETREALGVMLRPGNAGANTAADHVTVLDRALEHISAEHIESIEILVRALELIGVKPSKQTVTTPPEAAKPPAASGDFTPSPQKLPTRRPSALRARNRLVRVVPDVA